MSLLRTEYLSSGSGCVNKQSIRFFISLRVTFSDSVAFTVLNKYDNRAVVEISAVFGPIYHVACPRLL